MSPLRKLAATFFLGCFLASSPGCLLEPVGDEAGWQDEALEAELEATAWDAYELADDDASAATEDTGADASNEPDEDGIWPDPFVDGEGEGQ
ncbi:hypothetical protein [Haliangium ochraceum]|uniref:Uncharacterized protein n=1 Tax=Haliangium ochraceum (strain DSM 14365 / JCM 11303 / SMP-2) TaxID=502025 RepID=D0LYK1_HALO1|nr:hypothetical protein [Haliangium ochraceum]ACY17867.1 hypothetical protein Hoch_5383 [Haliangium ochraceum DSM 14365]